MANCIDCGIKIKKWDAKRCRPCYVRFSKINRLFSNNTAKQSEKELKPIAIDRLIIQTLKNELNNTISYTPASQSKTDIKGDTLVIHLTDLHAGKIVKDQDGKIIYNEEIFRNRINRLCEQILKLL